VKVEIIDTVGAGDTVGAIIVEAVLRLGLSSLMADLEPVLVRAAKAAAITCLRAGAQPPSIAELAAF
jgi:fructokinase